jgi:acyl carrier protein
MPVQVPADQPLMEAGLDSLGAVDLRNSLSAQFSVKLPTTLTFDHPTLTALAAYIASLSGGQGDETNSSHGIGAASVDASVVR